MQKVAGLLILVVFLACGAASSAQEGKGYAGTVTDTGRKAINNVVCKLLNQNNATLSYSLSDGKGCFFLSYHEKGVKMTFSKMGYASDTIAVSSTEKSYAVVLKEQAIDLHEVVVETEPVSRSGDTLRYNVNAFRQKEDLYIEDVIKRLPGITVSQSGQILYQGRSINKVNIEGIDLMGSNYNQATRNMPADAVAQIQVLENNQPVKALEGRVQSDKATLNIKLNRNRKLRPFGEVAAMGGISPGRWDNRLNVFNINPKNQLFVTAGMNNQGNDFSYLRNSVSDDYIYLQEPLPPTVLSGADASTPPLSPLYYLQNKSWYTSANYLYAFTPESVLKFNAVYHHNSLHNNDSSYMELDGRDTIAIYDANRLKARQDYARGKLTYELNSKKLFLQEALTAVWQKDKSWNLSSTNTGDVEEHSRQSGKYLQNTLNMTLNVKERQLQISSILRYYENPERLFVSPQLTQNTKLRQLFMRNRLGTSFPLLGNYLTLAYIMEAKRNKFSEEAATSASPTSTYWLHTVEPTYEIHLPSGGITLLLPVEYIDYRYRGDSRFTQGKWMFSPSLRLSLKFSDYTLLLNAAQNHNGNTSGIATGNILRKNYRTVEATLDSLSFVRTHFASASLSYMNTLRMFSWSLYAAWAKNRFDSYTSSFYTPSLTLILPVWGRNSQTSFTLSYNLMKVFRSPGITLSNKGSFVARKMLVAQNSVEGYLRRRIVSEEISVDWTKLDWVHASLTVAGNMTWKCRDSFSSSHQLLKNYYYTLRTDLFPVDKLRAFIDFSQSSSEITHGNYSRNYFVNIGASYQLSKRLSLEFSALNLFNRKVYSESSYDGSLFNYYEVPLRGREITMGARFRF